MTFDEYSAIITRMLSGMQFAGIHPGASEDVSAYYQGHLPRFRVQFSLLANLARVETVLDLGTWFPFSSYFFHLRDGARVVYGCHRPVAGVAGCDHRQFNLCHLPDLPQSDLVICTEVLEHLPCNVVDVWDYVVGLIRPDGHLLVSFPLGGKNADNYHVDHGDWATVHGHIREFTGTSAGAFLARSRLRLIQLVDSEQPAYRRPIRNVLLQREA